MSIEKRLIRHSFLKVNTCFISEWDATKSKVSWWGILSLRRVVSVQTALKPRLTESFDHVVVLQSAIEEWVIGGISYARFRDIKKQQMYARWLKFRVKGQYFTDFNFVYRLSRNLKTLHPASITQKPLSPPHRKMHQIYTMRAGVKDWIVLLNNYWLLVSPFAIPAVDNVVVA